MFARTLPVVALPFLGLLACAAPLRAATLAGGDFGDVTLVQPSAPMRGFVVLFSDAQGWRAADQQAADALGRAGAMVVGVDTARYARRLTEVKEACHPLLGEVESISHQLQREARSSRYFLPIVAGTGQGGALAARMLARAPANTLGGAAVVDGQGRLDARFQPCAPDATISRGRGLPGFYEAAVIDGAGDAPLAGAVPKATSAVPTASTASASNGPNGVRMTGKDGKPATAATAARAAHDDGWAPSEPLPAPRRLPAGTTRADALVGLLATHLVVPSGNAQDLSDLPLIELPAAHGSDKLAIVISGDGGWRDLDKSIAESLQRQGVSVIGWDALRYFWKTKPPAQASRDLARVIAGYGARWHTRDVALIGYSFGADVMPFLYTRLPEEVRREVSYVSLLGFSRSADFQIRVTGWLGLPASDEALPTLPEVAKLPPALVQCVYGKEEEETACPALARSGAAVVALEGGHHFGEDYDRLARSILAGWQQQIARRR